MAGVTGLNIVLLLLCVAGVGLSYYAYFVEIALEKNDKYQPMCDINENVKCSKVFQSKYSKGFGLVAQYLGEKHILNQPNGLYGIGFYALFALLSLTSSGFLAKLQVLLALLANGSSVYLGYILFAVLHEMCVVCVSTYVLNFLLLVVATAKAFSTGKKLSRKAQKAQQSKQKKASKKKN